MAIAKKVVRNKHIRLEAADMAALERLARESGRSVSEVIALLVRQEIKRGLYDA